MNSIVGPLLCTSYGSDYVFAVNDRAAVTATTSVPGAARIERAQGTPVPDIAADSRVVPDLAKGSVRDDTR